jgi:transketolase
MTVAITPTNIRTWSMLGSAGTFGVACLDLPNLNDRAVVLTADLRAFSGLDRFQQRFPDRLINVGIAEQNMVGMATGLATEGFTVFATTYATFASARAADPVRVNLGYMGANVKLFGMAGGVSVGILGPTHMSIEDFAIMRAIPNMTVIAPADCTETVKVVHALAEHEGPVYVRLGGGVPYPSVYSSDYEFRIGVPVEICAGDQVGLIATGSMVPVAVAAASLLEAEGKSASVMNVHTLKPLEEASIARFSRQHEVVITIEEHNVFGGLGSAVAEVLAKHQINRKFSILGIDDFFPHAGSYEHLLEVAGLTPTQIVARVLRVLD